MAKISKRLVDATDPDPSRRFFVWDVQIKGFGLLVLPTGVKSYVFQYRTNDGIERRATLGKHGALTAEEARTKADKMRHAVQLGADPLGEKRDRQKAATVGEVLDTYLESQHFKGKAPQTQATDRGRINRHLKPTLGNVPVTLLRDEQIKRAFADIRDGKTAMKDGKPIREKMGSRALARVRGGEGAARKSVRLLRSVLGWAVREKLITDNAARDSETGTDGVRDVILEDAQAYGRLFKTLDKMEAEKRIRPAAADAIRVIALTGARRGEVTGMLWQHVDLKAGLVTLPASGHKTGKKTGKPRIIGLPTAAQTLVARQPAREPKDYVFAPSHGAGPIVLSKLWTKIRAEAELPQGIGLHGLRHSLASHMAMQGAQASEIMTALGHRSITTSAKYIHWANDARQAVAERAASVALAGMSSGAGKDSAEVKTLPGVSNG